MTHFNQLFEQLSGFSPYPWQQRLADDVSVHNRLIRIPTGLGKTQGVLLAWIYHRIMRNDPSWPRRLVWCLPMRVLVEQTRMIVELLRDRLKHESGNALEFSVHLLMGGEDAGNWALHPGRKAVLIGTQDMLLSRVLNRGYAAYRARWPLEFGLLHQDCLWVMDEVQLMDVGLATSAQLQAYRELYVDRSISCAYTWWMSATLQPDWLQSVDTDKFHSDWVRNAVQVEPEERHDKLWQTEKRLVEIKKSKDSNEIAQYIREKHHAGKTGSFGRITLAIFNTVKRASDVYASLCRLVDDRVEVQIIHSRFRPHERKTWCDSILSRAACNQEADRIIIATQVVEAGVDISATTLVTELAPWSSLVQRFGRAARWGGSADVYVIDGEYEKDTDVLPYNLEELSASRAALQGIDGVGIADLEQYEENLDARQRARLYPYAPLHLLLERELLEFFDTTADLSGADLDISRFIRSGDEKDCYVFWRDIPSGGMETMPQPCLQELCPVPVSQLRKCLDKKRAAWVWDYLEGNWRPAKSVDVFPGQLILLDRTAGGYSEKTGWQPENRTPVSAVCPMRSVGDADMAVERETPGACEWLTIAEHGQQAGQELRRLMAEFTLSGQLETVMELALYLHDWGKAHPAFQASIVGENRPIRQDLAKAPDSNWLHGKNLYPMPDGSRRKGFRHELASLLALCEFLYQCSPDHRFLAGDWKLLFPEEHAEESPGGDLEQGTLFTLIDGLEHASFDLLLHLIVSHHGKVRLSLDAAPGDQDFPVHDPRLDGTGYPIRGIREADRLPSLQLSLPGGRTTWVPELELHLDLARLGLTRRYGPSYTERALKLLDRWGPFTLAWLEAMVRIADLRVSGALKEEVKA